MERQPSCLYVTMSSPAICHPSTYSTVSSGQCSLTRIRHAAIRRRDTNISANADSNPEYALPIRRARPVRYPYPPSGGPIPPTRIMQWPHEAHHPRACIRMTLYYDLAVAENFHPGKLQSRRIQRRNNRRILGPSGHSGTGSS